ncbi:CidA/LrgA family protein [Siccirubricoccus phaeus]|uniref:CidA/LrgA family protein n=1 Tax=Siccirubricoccus phaeus TaxID=2595053 RepID=UPI001F30F8F7|nr:CidA/LrgA family protein [Siccirubricoccus phaeus]
MIGALAALLSCQLAGEVAVRALHLPVPGPVIGMVLLFLWLQARRAEAPAPSP